MKRKILKLLFVLGIIFITILNALPQSKCTISLNCGDTILTCNGINCSVFGTGITCRKDDGTSETKNC